jgi:AhpD family alkylhydroperoxidase
MRIDAKALDDYPWYLRPLFWAQQRRYGAALNSALVWARSPKLFLGLAVLYGMVDRKGSPLDPALRSLVTVRVSQINHCPFCVDINSATLLERGMPAEKLNALDSWRGNDLFSEKECVALEYAEAMTFTDSSVDDELFRRVKIHFDEEATVELTGLIAFQNMSSKFNSALDIQPQGFCALPARTNKSTISAESPR